MTVKHSNLLPQKFISAICFSILISTGLLIALPVILFMVLLFGIAGLPYAGPIIMVVLSLIVFLPGIVVNVYLAQGFSVVQRVVAVIVYLLIFCGLIFLFFNFVKGGFQSIGQF